MQWHNTHVVIHRYLEQQRTKKRHDQITSLLHQFGKGIRIGVLQLRFIGGKAGGKMDRSRCCGCGGGRCGLGLKEQDGRWHMARRADKGGRGGTWSLPPSSCALRQWCNLVQKVHGTFESDGQDGASSVGSCPGHCIPCSSTSTRGDCHYCTL